MKRILYEQHLLSPDIGMLHAISDSPILDDTLNRLTDAADMLYYQYEAGMQGGVDICIQHLNNFGQVMGSGVLTETYRDVYLVNPAELMKFLHSEPECSNETYLMSSNLERCFHEALQSPDHSSLEDLIIEICRNHGLLYSVVFDNHAKT